MVHINVSRQEVRDLASRLDQANLTDTDQTVLAALIAAAAPSAQTEVEVTEESFGKQFAASFVDGASDDTVLKINKISRSPA